MKYEERYKFYNELGFFTLCNAAPALGKFLKDTITISSPKTELLYMKDLKMLTDDWVYTTVVFNKQEIGQTHVFLEKEDAIKLANYVIQRRLENAQEVTQLDDFAINAVEEVMNILGGNMTEILTVVFGKGVELDVPEMKYGEDGKSLYEENDELVLNTFSVYLGSNEKIKMKELALQSYYKELVNQLKNRV